MRKKEVLNKIVSKSGMTCALRYYTKYFQNNLPILAYHRIIDYDEDKYHSDIELVSANTQTFEKQIKYLKKYFHPLRFSDLTKYFSNTKLHSKPPVIITFDDGFYDNYQYAYPILKKHTCPATFFVVTDVLDYKTPLWFDLLAFLILNSERKTFIFDDEKIQLNLSTRDRRQLIEKLLLDLRYVSNKKRLSIMNELKAQLQSPNHNYESNNYMSWDNIKEMNDGGMEFGSHSVSHPILAQMNNDDITYEVCHSKSRIEKELKTECEVFAYPVGGFEEYNEFTKYSLGQAAYKYACTYEPGINKFPLSDQYQLRRIHMERYTSFDSFKNLLISPIFGYK